MSKLYAINQATGENEPLAELSESDWRKVGRGHEIGHSFGIVTDTETGKQFEIFQASCRVDNCNCAVTAQEV